ncbi:uncharacterized protein LOC128680340 [Plodia interpunctella]|uniref:uncharacterized protein LOC128680340 n=1 Tax=Plodia interpunctella TaxID=58824 RepID=UPI002367A1DA|nr:uncharacterized protein LOC128680340 [Plodia interpunctella]
MYYTKMVLILITIRVQVTGDTSCALSRGHNNPKTKEKTYVAKNKDKLYDSNSRTTPGLSVGYIGDENITGYLKLLKDNTKLRSITRFPLTTLISRRLALRQQTTGTMKGPGVTNTLNTKIQPTPYPSTVPAQFRDKMRSSAPPPVTADHHCDFKWTYCMRVYNTGAVCGRTVYYTYNTFDSWCVLDYVNCREGTDIWIGIHTGPCLRIEPYSEYIHYPYEDDYHLDRDLVIDDM